MIECRDELGSLDFKKNYITFLIFFCFCFNSDPYSIMSLNFKLERSFLFRMYFKILLLCDICFLKQQVLLKIKLVEIKQILHNITENE